jgi:dTDP-4-amino-4,6-dideoxygalactose transaminase
VTLADTTIDEAEIEAVSAVLRSRWLSPGPTTRAFENEFAQALGISDAVAVSSGTAALHLAMLALGIGPGDEVIMPSLSFVSAAEVTVLQGASPVFVDVRSGADLTVDTNHVRRSLTSRTKAIVAMHYGGFSADLEELVAIGRQHGVAIVEDAAHAPVVRRADATVGTVGDVGCFSFFATKNLTTGEGGMVVARDPALLGRVRLARSHFMSATTELRMRTGTADYDVTGLGLNYRPTEISSALGRVQLGRLGADRARRRKIWAIYMDALAGRYGLVLPFADRVGDSAYHLAVVVLPDAVDRAVVRSALTEVGIQTSVHYPPTHLFSYYRDRFPAGCRLPETEKLAPRLLTLPLHARMSDDAARFVADNLLEILRQEVGR